MTDLRTRDGVEPSPYARRGAHRAAPSRLAALLPVVVVAAAVGLTVLVVVFLTGLGGRGDGGQGSASAPAATATPTRSSPQATDPPTTPTTPTAPTGSSGTGPAASDPASGTASGDPTSPAPTSGPASSAPGVDESGADDAAPPPPGGDGAPGARGAPVVVLNATATSGLAGRTADDLKAEGWTVSRTGDAPRGSVDATKVRYSDPSLESAAQAVAASLGGAAVERDAGAARGVVTVVAGPDRAGR